MYGHLRRFDGEMHLEYGASIFYQIFRQHFQKYIGNNEISDVIKSIVQYSDLYISPEFCEDAVFETGYTGKYKC